MKITPISLKNNMASILLVALCSRMFITGAGIGDALVIIGLSALVGFLNLQEKKEISEAEQLKLEVKQVKEAIQSLKIERSLRKPANGSNQNQGRIF